MPIFVLAPLRQSGSSRCSATLPDHYQRDGVCVWAPFRVLVVARVLVSSARSFAAPGIMPPFRPVIIACRGYSLLVATTNAADYIPDTRELSVLAEAAMDCQGCGLYRDANHTVFGAGPSSASMVLVGEQPGDQEDRAGRTVCGPRGTAAGQRAGCRRDRS